MMVDNHVSWVVVGLVVYGAWVVFGKRVYEAIGALEISAAVGDEEASRREKQQQFRFRGGGGVVKEGREVANLMAAPPPTEELPRSTVVVTVNGKTHRVEGASPRTTLLWWLREELGLTGAKIGCGEGGCGACTVVETLASGEKRAINACLRLLVACDGCCLTTVEGLGSSKSGFSDEQVAVADGNGSQCGYCTPGWVAAMHALRGDGLTGKDLEQKLDGNICRCTGYAPIVKAFKESFAIEECGDVASCHDVRSGAKCGRDCATKAAAVSVSGPPLTTANADGVTYVAPTSLTELFAVVDGLSYASETSLVGGCTAAIGVSKYYDDALAPWAGGFAPASDACLVATKTVPELVEIGGDDEVKTVGAAVTITDLLAVLEAGVSEENDPKLEQAARHLKRVANTQVRNSATWAGNLVLLAKAPAFISDVLIALSVAGATVEVSVRDPGSSSVEAPPKSRRATRQFSPVELVSQLRTSALPGCVILRARIPVSSSSKKKKTVVAFTDKVSARHSNAHAICNFGAWLETDGARTITQALCVSGGLHPTKLQLTKVEAALRGQSLDDPATLTSLLGAIRASASDSTSYQADLAAAFAYKWFKKASVQQTNTTLVSSLAVDRPETQSSYELAGADDPTNAPASVGRVKLAARLQASGEAVYCTDASLSRDELFCAFAHASSAGVLTDVTVSNALRVPDAVAVLTAADLVDAYGAVGTLADDDDPLLYAVGDSVFVGARVAIAVSTSYLGAIETARTVASTIDSTATLALARVVDPAPALLEHYDDRAEGDHNGDTKQQQQQRKKTKPPSAVRGKWRKMGLPRGKHALEVKNGAVRLDFKTKTGSSPSPTEQKTKATVTVSGTVTNGSQKHFTMETHAARAVPVENGGLEVTSSSQDNALTQQTIAAALGVSDNAVVVYCRRAGGGFGSKLSLHLAAATAVSIVADQYGRPARLHAERRDDQKMTGGREACSSAYEIVADRETGLVQTYAVDMTLKAGCASGDATGDLAMAVAWSDSVYKAQVQHTATGACETTAAPRNTSMRSPGVVQSHCAHEVAMVHLAHALGKDVHTVQEANFYAVGDESPYGYVLGENGFNYTVPELWKRMKPKYLEKKEAVDAFNTRAAGQGSFKFRGVHMAPTKFIMQLSYWTIPALVAVFPDGSVQVTTGGSEIGQGLYTKVAACTAYALGCDLSAVRVCPTATDKVPNSACTGGSGTSESACNAAMLACATIKARLDPYLVAKSGEKDISFADAVADALADGIELCATGWNAVGGDDPDYATYGVAVAEVEVDALTGEVSVRDLDVLMDQGISLNSDIDLGQIQGGLVMTLGFYFTEVNTVSDDGLQSGDGTWEYKPPMISDIPLKWHVSLLENTPNTAPVAVLRSKASGEPPMQLAQAAFLAARDAVRAARAALSANTDWFDLPIPATPKHIRAACLVTDDMLTL